MRGSFIKKAATAAAGVILLSCMGMTGVWANYSPEDYIITLYFEDVECSYGYSSPQDKDNDSYGLVFYDTRGRLGYEAAMIGGDYETDFSILSYYLEPGDTAYMTNYVYESGYRSARLRGQSCYDMVYQVMGAWTADLY